MEYGKTWSVWTKILLYKCFKLKMEMDCVGQPTENMQDYVYGHSCRADFDVAVFGGVL